MNIETVNRQGRATKLHPGTGEAVPTYVRGPKAPSSASTRGIVTRRNLVLRGSSPGPLRSRYALPGFAFEQRTAGRPYDNGGYSTGETKSPIFMRVALIAAFLTAFYFLIGPGWQPIHGGHAVAAPLEGAPIDTPRAALPGLANLLRMGPVSTGVIAVDDALRGFLAGDVDQAMSHLVVEQVPCGTVPWGGRPVLVCRAGEAAGAVHELTLAGCEPKWVAAAAARRDIAALLADRPGVYAVTRSGASFIAALSWPGAPDHSLVLTVTSAGIASYAACPLNLAANR